MVKKIATSKRLYIALFFFAVVMGALGYVRSFRLNLKKEISTFDESAWQDAVEESGFDVVGTEVTDEDYIVAEVVGEDEWEYTETEAPEAEAEAEVEETVAESEQPFYMEMPCKGETIGECSIEDLVYCETTEDWRTHNGIDIAAALGEPVLATADGVVSQIYEDEFMGLVLVLDHKNGVNSVYGNVQSRDFIAVGTAVSRGDVIGGVGKAGILEKDMESHLHFEVQCDGEYMDPETYMASAD